MEDETNFRAARFVTGTLETLGTSARLPFQFSSSDSALHLPLLTSSIQVFRQPYPFAQLTGNLSRPTSSILLACNNPI